MGYSASLRSLSPMTNGGGGGEREGEGAMNALRNEVANLRREMEGMRREREGEEGRTATTAKGERTGNLKNDEAEEEDEFESFF
jgi:hypothetical protein